MRAQRQPGWPRWLRLPGRTVRMRLTILYGFLFVVSGALMLALASGVAVHSSSSVEARPAFAAGSKPDSSLAQAEARVRQLQAQVSQLQSRGAGPSRPNSRSCRMCW